MNVRKCNRCEQPIKRDNDNDFLGTVAAWLAGFCSTKCMYDHAYATVLAGRAWWQVSND